MKIKKSPNCKSVSYLKFNNNKSLQNFSVYSNSNSNSNKISKIFLIKKLNTLNKKSNFSLNEINKLNSCHNNQKKLTLNLSNINVINVYNNQSSNEIYSNSLKIPRIIQKINTFFVREKPKNNIIFQQNKKNVNNMNGIRKIKKKNFIFKFKKIQRKFNK